jgi:outer membrane protein assembly factor BamE (lipoprotein component of BamABCDE complex)
MNAFLPAPRRSRRGRAATLALAVALAAVGCRSPHYVVIEDDAPLYATPQGDEVVARMPRYHHEPLEDRPGSSAVRVPVTFEGQAGWAERNSIRTFDYLHPTLDDGQSREKAIRREVRELQLAELGSEWSNDDVAAIRAERVRPGMTRTQVEVAWGWPVSVESTGAPGGERWVYRDCQVTPVRRWVESPWSTMRGAGASIGHHDDWRQYPAWVTVRVPVTIERVVEFDERGEVTRVQQRRYLDEAGSS